MILITNMSSEDSIETNDSCESCEDDVDNSIDEVDDFDDSIEELRNTTDTEKKCKKCLIQYPMETKEYCLGCSMCKNSECKKIKQVFENDYCDECKLCDTCNIKKPKPYIKNTCKDCIFAKQRKEYSESRHENFKQTRRINIDGTNFNERPNHNPFDELLFNGQSNRHTHNNFDDVPFNRQQNKHSHNNFENPLSKFSNQNKHDNFNFQNYVPPFVEVFENSAQNVMNNIILNPEIDEETKQEYIMDSLNPLSNVSLRYIFNTACFSKIGEELIKLFRMNFVVDRIFVITSIKKIIETNNITTFDTVIGEKYPNAKQLFNAMLEYLNGFQVSTPEIENINDENVIDLMNALNPNFNTEINDVINHEYSYIIKKVEELSKIENIQERIKLFSAMIHEIKDLKNVFKQDSEHYDEYVNCLEIIISII